MPDNSSNPDPSRWLARAIAFMIGAVSDAASKIASNLLQSLFGLGVTGLLLMAGINISFNKPPPQPASTETSSILKATPKPNEDELRTARAFARCLEQKTKNMAEMGAAYNEKSADHSECLRKNPRYLFGPTPEEICAPKLADKSVAKAVLDAVTERTCMKRGKKG